MLIAKGRHIKEFAEDVRSLFRNRIDRVMLYGSYAREEEVPGSDIDIAVILTELKDGDRKKLQNLTENWIQETDLRFSPRLFEKESFEERIQEGYSFHGNVEEEGVEI